MLFLISNFSTDELVDNVNTFEVEDSGCLSDSDSVLLKGRSDVGELGESLDLGVANTLLRVEISGDTLEEDTSVSHVDNCADLVSLELEGWNYLVVDDVSVASSKEFELAVEVTCEEIEGFPVQILFNLLNKTIQFVFTVYFLQ
jgi:hypothetical protein